MHLVDYKVRILDETTGTAAKPRVIIESAADAERWGTVGVPGEHHRGELAGPV